MCTVYRGILSHRWVTARKIYRSGAKAPVPGCDTYYAVQSMYVVRAESALAFRLTRRESSQYVLVWPCHIPVRGVLPDE